MNTQIPFKRRRSHKRRMVKTSAEAQKYIHFRCAVIRQIGVSLSLAKQVFFGNTKYKNLNLVFSPLSIQIVLGLIASGSKDPTKNQILKFLKRPSIQRVNLLFSRLVTLLYADESRWTKTNLSFTNSIWFDVSLNLKPTFKQIVDNDYKALSNYVDFQTKAEEQVRQEVNTWFKKQTNDLIEEILSSGSVNDSTRIIFANAVYFKGIWKNKFDKFKTKRDKFFLLNGTSIQVPFMTSYDNQYIEEFDGFKALKLRYKQFSDQLKFSMYIYLPDDVNSKDGGLLSLLEKIESESGFISDCDPSKKVRVGDFRIPLFKIDFGFEASEDLKRLGLELPFELSDDVANVSGIFHKSFIEVNEQGTLAEAEAAAPATSDVPTDATLWPHSEQLDFVADHPFLFAIREELTTGAVLFIGQVVDPADFSS